MDRTDHRSEYNSYHWLQSLTAANEKPSSLLQNPEPVTWQSQVANTSYVWDPGTILQHCLVVVDRRKGKGDICS
jgi:hypothetical protein